MKIIHKIAAILLLQSLAGFLILSMLLPQFASAATPLNGPQGGTGVPGILSGYIPFGGSSLLRIATSSAFSFDSALSKLTVTNYGATNGTTTNSTSTNINASGSFRLGSDLITDLTGTNLSIVDGALTAASAAGDGVSNWLFNGTRLTPSTTPVGIAITGSSTIGGGTGATGLTINGTATTTALVVPALTSALTITDGQGLFAEYAGTTCTNQFIRILSALGAATCATVDISADTNLTVDGTEIVLTGDALSLGTALTFTTGTSSTAFQTALLGVGTDYISDITGTGIINTAGALQASLGTSITASEMADGDHGFFSYATNVASLDTGGITSNNLLTALTDETGTGLSVFATNPLFTGLRSNASSTISDLTITSGTSTLLNILTTLMIPDSSAPVLAATGSIAYDDTDMQFLVGTSTSATPGVLRIVDTIAKFKVPSTSPMFATSTTTYFPTEEDGFTVTDIYCSVEGGTSKIITVFGESVTCDTDGQADDGAITINTVAAASTTVPFTAGNTSGVVNWLNVTVKGKWTRE